MNVFLTGATGVIGRRVVPLLVSAGHDVIGVGRTPEKRAALERLGARGRDADLFDPEALRRVLEGRDTVVNLATHMPSSTIRAFLPGAWAENDRLRREASAKLVDAALAVGARRFVQESFAPVYPDRGADWIDESVPIQPARHNGSVADAERSAARFSAAGGSGVVLRFAAFYGPDSFFLADLVRLIRHGFAPMPGSPDAFVSSISHDDAAAAVLAALTLPPGTYNVSDDEPVSHREYVDSLARALDVPSPKLPPRWATPLFGAPGSMLARSLRISNRKLREAGGLRPRYPSVRDGWPDALEHLGASPSVAVHA